MFDFFKKKYIIIKSPVNGKAVALSEVPDEVFSSKMVGDGIAVIPANGNIVSPVNGKIVQIFPTNHAIGIISDEGLEILIHLGIDTVELKGEGFTRLVEVGADVKEGTPLIKMNLEAIKNNGKDIITPVIITNMEMVGEIKHNYSHVNAGTDEILKISLRK
jgi:PTS system glucose-specific IIA component